MGSLVFFFKKPKIYMCVRVRLARKHNKVSENDKQNITNINQIMALQDGIS